MSAVGSQSPVDCSRTYDNTVAFTNLMSMRAFVCVCVLCKVSCHSHEVIIINKMVLLTNKIFLNPFRFVDGNRPMPQTRAHDSFRFCFRFECRMDFMNCRHPWLVQSMRHQGGTHAPRSTSGETKDYII